MQGSDKCRMHAGKRSADVKLDAQAARALARLDVPPVDDPLSALALLAGQAIAWKDDMAAKVAELTSLRYSTEGGEQLRSEVALWERALDRCERFCVSMARLDIDERLTAIAEAQAEVILSVFSAALGQAGITGDQADAVLTAADEEFARRAGIAV